MFNLETAITDWRSRFRKHESFHDGTVAELEAHLRDLIDHRTGNGEPAESAFNKAVLELGDIGDIHMEYQHVTKERRGHIVQIRHTLRHTFRYLFRNPVFSLINLAGLAIAMGSSLLLLLWVLDAIKVDRFHEHADQIYGVIQERSVNTVFITPSTPAPLAGALSDSFPEISHGCATLISRGQFTRPQFPDREIDLEGLAAGPDFFRIFSFPLLDGTVDQTLEGPDTIYLTASAANRIFGSVTPVGKPVRMNADTVFSVAGVLKDIPRHSHLQFDYVLSTNHLIAVGHKLDNWDRSAARTYIRLHPETDTDKLSRAVEPLVTDHSPGVSSRLILQPLAHVHLVKPEGGGLIVYVIICAGLSIVILLMGCINFVNLSSARALTRLRETSVRKICGASSAGIFNQSMIEAALHCLIALLICLTLVQMTIPPINSLLNCALSLNPIQSPILWGLIPLLTITTTLVSGIYPALFMSRISIGSPSASEVSPKPGRTGSRGMLITLQFASAAVLIIIALIIYGQLKYLTDRGPGFEPKNILYMPLGQEGQPDLLTLKQDLAQTGAITHVTISNRRMLYLGFETSAISWEGQQPGEEVNMQLRTVDTDYLDTFQMGLSKGRFMDITRPGEMRDGIVINETAANVMNLENPIGRWLNISDRPGRIIGVVKDFHVHSLHEPVEPVALLVEPDWNRWLFVRYAPGHEHDAMATLRNHWDRINPEESFTVRHLEHDIATLYRNEHDMQIIMIIFTLLALTIACLGLLGMSAFIVENRTKEIGIRKTLGASTWQVQLLLNRELLRWIFLANAIALPIGFFAGSRWLENFAVRAPMGALPFFIGVVLTGTVALGTVSIQTLRAARSNPVDALRSE